MANVTNYDFDYDMSPVVLWQYNDAERLKAIIANEQAFLDENVSSFYKDFNRDVLNITTANTFGLNVWGILLGVPRPSYRETITEYYYGWKDVGPIIYTKKPLDELQIGDPSYTYSGNEMILGDTIRGVDQRSHAILTDTWYFRFNTDNDTEITSQGPIIPFSDEQYRLLLRARIYLLTFDGSARALNEFFHILFPDLQVTVTDNGDMTADISVLNDMDPEIAVLFQNPYAEIFLPRPSGVRYNTATAPLDLSTTFTFEGMTDENGNPGGNFDNGVFISG